MPGGARSFFGIASILTRVASISKKHPGVCFSVNILLNLKILRALAEAENLSLFSKKK